jgi:hypothetical protein
MVDLYIEQRRIKLGLRLALHFNFMLCGEKCSELTEFDSSSGNVQ